MTALTIVLIVIAAVLLIIGLILIIPADVGIGTFTDERFRFSVRVLFFKFGTNEKKKNDKESGADTLRKLLGFGKSDGKTKHASVSASDVVKIAAALLKAVGRMMTKGPIKKLYVRSVSAGDAAEAAFDYGVACSVIYPAVGFLESRFCVSEKGKDLTVACDYESEKAVFEAETVIRIRLFRLVGVFFILLKEYLTAKKN